MNAFLPYILVILTISMAYVSGANDGGAILALPARNAQKSVARHVAALSTSILLGPLVLTSVAETLVNGLFKYEGMKGHVIFMLGTVAGLVLVSVMNRLGMPTSLTLALVGGLTGAGFGGGASVDPWMVVRVLLIGLAAPIVGFFLAIIGFKVVDGVGGLADRSVVFRPLAGFFFGLLTLAYAINDGQKMIAIASVAILSITPGIDILAAGNMLVRVAVSALLVVFFTFGIFARIRRVGYRLGFGLARARGVEGLVSQGAAAAAVLASSVLGAPVSMTQAISASIVGSTILKGAHRVRWISVTKMLGAWVVTLPAAFFAAYGLGKVFV